MIGPNMATMLSVVLTDAALTPADAQAALAAAVARQLQLHQRRRAHQHQRHACCCWPAAPPAPQPLAGAGPGRVRRGALREVCIELARQIPDDGEGATHLITIDVQGCATRTDACRIAKTVADSALVKTAIAGGDPNWGRIVSAAGYAGVPFDPQRLQPAVNGTLLFRRRSPGGVRRRRGLALDAGQPRDAAWCCSWPRATRPIRFWTSDLTVDYVQVQCRLSHLTSPVDRSAAPTPAAVIVRGTRPCSPIAR